MAKKVKAPATISESLRAAILGSEKTLYRIAKDCELAYPSVHSFVRGRRELSMAALNKICAYLNLQLTSAKGN
jgi:hypothetical protein